MGMAVGGGSGAVGQVEAVDSMLRAPKRTHSPAATSTIAAIDPIEGIAPLFRLRCSRFKVESPCVKVKFQSESDLLIDNVKK
jgi:hypothetical protein